MKADKPFQPNLRILARVEQITTLLNVILLFETPADMVVSQFFKAYPQLGGRDRGEVATATFDVLRHLKRYRIYAQSVKGSVPRRLALLGLSNAIGLETLSQALTDPAEREWLEHTQSIDQSALAFGVRFSLPDWLVDQINALPEPEALAQALLKPASFDLRVNTLKARREEVMTEIMSDQRQRFSPEVTPFSPWGIRLYGHPPINTWDLFIKGGIEVQDEGSQLLALLVEPKRGEMVIDFCAGAGGKSLALAAMMKTTGRLYAFDVSAGRLARAKPRFARSGLSNVHPVVIRNENDDRVKRLAGKAHRVLVDAPCTGVGTLRRNPDLKWRYPESGLTDICAQQSRILDRASQCVRPGGRLVYATCSFLPEENELQVQAFLERNSNFELIDASAILKHQANLEVDGPMVHLRPDQHQTDAFFAAVMTRKAAPPAPAHKPKLESKIDTAVQSEFEVDSVLDLDSAPELDSVSDLDSAPELDLSPKLDSASVLDSVLNLDSAPELESTLKSADKTEPSSAAEPSQEKPPRPKSRPSLATRFKKKTK
jgi:16S rRNA (cytosine967-C5)-methyltransferase